MNMNSINSNPIRSNTAQVSTSTAENKTIRNEIALKEQRLNQLSSDSKLSQEEKEKKSQEIKNQIAELNRKLQLLEMQKKEESKKSEKEQEQKTALQEELQKDVAPAEQERESDSDLSDSQPKHVDMPVKDIQEMLNADYVLQRELAAKSIAAQKANAIDILESEIQQDDLRNTDTTFKKEELLDMRKMENFWTENKKQAQEPLPSGMNPDMQVSVE